MKQRHVSDHKTSVTKGYLLARCLSMSYRSYFAKWKLNTEFKQVYDEVHNEGPVREEIFDVR
jgi:hypothetical protein